MPSEDVQLVMNEYLKGQSKFKGQLCNKNVLAPMGAKLMEMMNSFIIRAEDFRRP
jgi:hypothetical protein